MKHIRTHLSGRAVAAFALCGSLGLGLALSGPVAARAVTSDELQSQLDAALADLDDLQTAVDDATATLGRTNYELDQTRTQIAELQDQIDESEVQLGEARGELSELMSSNYKQGGNAGLLEMVLSAESFDELVSRVYYADKLSSAQQESIQTVVTLQESLRSDQAELEKQEAEQEKLLSSQETEQAAAAAAVAEQESYVNQLSDEVQQALAEEREREAEESRKRAEQARLEEERRQQEEAAQQQQQQEQQEQEETNNNGGGNDNGGSTTNGGTGSNGGSTVTPPSGGSSSATSSQREIAVNAALSQVGKPYGHANNGYEWDCNGLTHWAWAQAGVSIPASSGTYAYGQFQWMKSSGRWVTSTSQLQPGDLVFYSRDGGYTCYHVAMYIGGGQVVHAEGYGWGVTVRSVTYCSGFCGGGSPI